MSYFKTREDFLTPNQVAILTPNQILKLVEMAIENALQKRDSFEAQFDGLPAQISARKVSQFLKKSEPTINTWKKEGKLNFTYPEGKHPYITRRQFMKDCMTHKLI